MNQPIAKPFRVGNSLVVVIPKDHAQEMGIAAGDPLEMLYNGRITIRKATQDRE